MLTKSSQHFLFYLNIYLPGFLLYLNIYLHM